MRNQHLVSLGTLAAGVFGLVAFTGSSMVAQTAPQAATPRAGGTPQARAAAARAPRTPWGHPDLQGTWFVTEDVLAWIRPPASAIDAVTQQEQIELERRERAYRDGRPPASVDGRIAVLIDDGLATGSTMRAAVLAVRRL